MRQNCSPKTKLGLMVQDLYKPLNEALIAAAIPVLALLLAAAAASCMVGLGGEPAHILIAMSR